MRMSEDSSSPAASNGCEMSTLTTPVEVAQVLRVPITWVYAHQKEIPGLVLKGMSVDLIGIEPMTSSMPFGSEAIIFPVLETFTTTTENFSDKTNHA